MIEIFADNLDHAARTTAMRAGDVLFRERAGKIPTAQSAHDHDKPVDALDELYNQMHELEEEPSYTEFLYEPTINAGLIPAAPKFDPHALNYEYHESAYKHPANLDNKSLCDELEAKRTPAKYKAAVTLGSMATASAGAELFTHNTLVDVAGLVAGGALGWIHSEVQDLRTLRAASVDIKDIQKKLAGSEQLVRLPNTSTAHYITAENMLTLQQTEIPVAGTQAGMLKPEDILAWLQHNIAVDGVVRAVYYSRGGASTPLRSKGASVTLNTSLWKEYYNSHIRNGVDFGDDVSRIAKEFIGSRDEIARKLKLKLSSAKPKLDEMVFLGFDKEKLNKKFHDDWQDVKLSFVQLPPGIVVSRLLRSAIDPTSLWQQIAPDLLTIQDNAIEQAAITEELKAIDRRAQHAGVTNHEDEVMTHGWQQRLNEVERSIFMTTLSVAGAAVLRDREHRYNSVREELMQTIGQTAYAQDQFGAMQLFDVGITALAQRLNPDSEEAISTARQLMNYLAGSVRHINGTESAYQQLYHGMQQKFPQLQLQ